MKLPKLQMKCIIDKKKAKIALHKEIRKAPADFRPGRKAIL